MAGDLVVGGRDSEGEEREGASEGGRSGEGEGGESGGFRGGGSAGGAGRLDGGDDPGLTFFTAVGFGGHLCCVSLLC